MTNTLASLSYGAAALGFVLLTVLSMVSWRGHPTGVRIIVASALSALWAGWLATDELTAATPFIIIYLLEIGRDAGWLLVLTSIASAAVPRGLRIGVHIAWSALLLAPLTWPFVIRFAPDAPILILSRGSLALALLGLLFLEQIYRNSSPSSRHALRYFAFGVGGLFAYDLFLYSQAELLRGIDANTWSARGIVNALAVPLLAIALRRNPQWSLDIFVSRQVVFHTATFIGVGAYLILMAIGGYYVRVIGGTWGEAAQIVFLSSAVAALGALLLSVSLRRRLKVFLNKHFYRNKYDYRVEWLRFIQTLSSSVDDDVEHASIRSVAQIFGSPGGLLFTLDEERQRFAVAASWPADQNSVRSPADIAADSDLVRLLAQRQWIIDLDEYRRQPQLYDNLALPDWLSRAAGLRIVSPILESDRLTGILLLDSPPAPFELTYEDRDLLRTVGRHIATALAQAAAARKLAESRQFEAYNKLTAFVMHDLKNLAAQLSLVVANAARHKHNPEFIEDATQTIANSVARMSRLIEQLRQGETQPAVRPVDFGTVVLRAVGRCSLREPAPQTNPAATTMRVMADAERLGMVLEHLIRNAQDATASDGRVEVTIGRDGDFATVAVSDTGEGMDPQFIRERLFRPFDTTKGSKGMGIGAYQAREYVRSIGGELSVQSVVGKGTTIQVRLPMESPETAAPSQTPENRHSEMQDHPVSGDSWHAKQLSCVSH